MGSDFQQMGLYDYTVPDTYTPSGTDWGTVNTPTLSQDDMNYVIDAIGSGQLTQADFNALNITPEDLVSVGIDPGTVAQIYSGTYNTNAPESGGFLSGLGSALGGLTPGQTGSLLGTLGQLGLGAYGAVAGKDAAQQAAALQSAIAQNISDKQIAEQRRQFDLTRQDFEPYRGLGATGVEELKAGGAGALPSYDEIVTNQLSNYANDPAVMAQKQLALKGLAQQQQARGIGSSASSANAAAELGMKYDTTGYDRFRSTLEDRYKAKLGEYGTKYDQILNKIKVGQGASGTVSQAGQNMANQVTQSLGNLGAAQQGAVGSQGTAAQQFYSGLGNVVPTAVSTMGNINEIGKKSGWWG